MDENLSPTPPTVPPSPPPSPKVDFSEEIQSSLTPVETTEEASEAAPIEVENTERPLEIIPIIPRRNIPKYKFKWSGNFSKQFAEMKCKTQDEVFQFIEGYSSKVRHESKLCCTRPTQALSLSKNISYTLFSIRDINKLFTFSSHYFNKITPVMSIYLDMELKASVRGMEKTSQITDRIIMNLETHFNASNEVYILESIVRMGRVWKKHKEIIDIVLNRYLNLAYDKPLILDDRLYIVYVVIFKKWMDITSLAMHKNELHSICSELVQPSPTFRFNKKYTSHLPNFNKQQNVTGFLVMAKFNAEPILEILMEHDYVSQSGVEIIEVNEISNLDVDEEVPQENSRMLPSTSSFNFGKISNIGRSPFFGHSSRTTMREPCPLPNVDIKPENASLECIDLTEDDDDSCGPDLEWLVALSNRCKNSLRVPHRSRAASRIDPCTLIETIDLDDDEDVDPPERPLPLISPDSGVVLRSPPNNNSWNEDDLNESFLPSENDANFSTTNTSKSTPLISDLEVQNGPSQDLKNHVSEIIDPNLPSTSGTSTSNSITVPMEIDEPILIEENPDIEKIINAEAVTKHCVLEDSQNVSVLLNEAEMVSVVETEIVEDMDMVQMVETSNAVQPELVVITDTDANLIIEIENNKNVESENIKESQPILIKQPEIIIPTEPAEIYNSRPDIDEIITSDLVEITETVKESISILSYDREINIISKEPEMIVENEVSESSKPSDSVGLELALSINSDSDETLIKEPQEVMIQMTNQLINKESVSMMKPSAPISNKIPETIISNELDIVNTIEQELVTMKEPEIVQDKELEVLQTKEHEIIKTKESEIIIIRELEMRISEPSVKITDSELVATNRAEIAIANEEEIVQINQSEIITILEPEIAKIQKPAMNNNEESEIVQVKEIDMIKTKEPKIINTTIESEASKNEEREVVKSKVSEMVKPTEPEMYESKESQMMRLKELELVKSKEPEIIEITELISTEKEIVKTSETELLLPKETENILKKLTEVEKNENKKSKNSDKIKQTEFSKVDSSIESLEQITNSEIQSNLDNILIDELYTYKNTIINKTTNVRTEAIDKSSTNKLIVEKPKKISYVNIDETVCLANINVQDITNKFDTMVNNEINVIGSEFLIENTDNDEDSLSSESEIPVITVQKTYQRNRIGRERIIPNVVETVDKNNVLDWSLHSRIKKAKPKPEKSDLHNTISTVELLRNESPIDISNPINSKALKTPNDGNVIYSMPSTIRRYLPEMSLDISKTPAKPFNGNIVFSTGNKTLPKETLSKDSFTMINEDWSTKSDEEKTLNESDDEKENPLSSNEVKNELDSSRQNELITKKSECWKPYEKSSFTDRNKIYDRNPERTVRFLEASVLGGLTKPQRNIEPRAARFTSFDRPISSPIPSTSKDNGTYTPITQPRGKTIIDKKSYVAQRPKNLDYNRPSYYAKELNCTFPPSSSGSSSSSATHLSTTFINQPSSGGIQIESGKNRQRFGRSLQSCTNQNVQQMDVLVETPKPPTRRVRNKLNGMTFKKAKFKRILGVNLNADLFDPKLLLKTTVNLGPRVDLLAEAFKAKKTTAKVTRQRKRGRPRLNKEISNIKESCDTFDKYIAANKKTKENTRNVSPTPRVRSNNRYQFRTISCSSRVSFTDVESDNDEPVERCFSSLGTCETLEETEKPIRSSSFSIRERRTINSNIEIDKDFDFEEFCNKSKKKPYDNKAKMLNSALRVNDVNELKDNSCHLSAQKKRKNVKDEKAKKLQSKFNRSLSCSTPTRFNINSESETENSMETTLIKQNFTTEKVVNNFEYSIEEQSESINGKFKTTTNSNDYLKKSLRCFTPVNFENDNPSETNVETITSIETELENSMKEQGDCLISIPINLNIIEDSEPHEKLIETQNLLKSTADLTGNIADTVSENCLKSPTFLIKTNKRKNDDQIAQSTINTATNELKNKSEKRFKKNKMNELRDAECESINNIVTYESGSEYLSENSFITQSKCSKKPKPIKVSNIRQLRSCTPAPIDINSIEYPEPQLIINTAMDESDIDALSEVSFSAKPHNKVSKKIKQSKLNNTHQLRSATPASIYTKSIENATDESDNEILSEVSQAESQNSKKFKKTRNNIRLLRSCTPAPMHSKIIEDAESKSSINSVPDESEKEDIEERLPNRKIKHKVVSELKTDNSRQLRSCTPAPMLFNNIEDSDQEFIINTVTDESENEVVSEIFTNKQVSPKIVRKLKTDNSRQLRSCTPASILINNIEDTEQKLIINTATDESENEVVSERSTNSQGSHKIVRKLKPNNSRQLRSGTTDTDNNFEADRSESISKPSITTITTREEMQLSSNQKRNSEASGIRQSENIIKDLVTKYNGINDRSNEDLLDLLTDANSLANCWPNNKWKPSHNQIISPNKNINRIGHFKRVHFANIISVIMPDDHVCLKSSFLLNGKKAAKANLKHSISDTVNINPDNPKLGQNIAFLIKKVHAVLTVTLPLLKEQLELKKKLKLQEVDTKKFLDNLNKIAEYSQLASQTTENLSEKTTECNNFAKPLENCKKDDTPAKITGTTQEEVRESKESPYLYIAFTNEEVVPVIVLRKSEMESENENVSNEKLNSDKAHNSDDKDHVETEKDMAIASVVSDNSNIDGKKQPKRHSKILNKDINSSILKSDSQIHTIKKKEYTPNNMESAIINKTIDYISENIQHTDVKNQIEVIDAPAIIEPLEVMVPDLDCQENTLDSIIVDDNAQLPVTNNVEPENLVDVQHEEIIEVTAENVQVYENTSEAVKIQVNSKKTQRKRLEVMKKVQRKISRRKKNKKFIKKASRLAFIKKKDTRLSNNNVLEQSTENNDIKKALQLASVKGNESFVSTYNVLEQSTVTASVKEKETYVSSNNVLIQSTENDVIEKAYGLAASLKENESCVSNNNVLEQSTENDDMKKGYGLASIKEDETCISNNNFLEQSMENDDISTNLQLTKEIAPIIDSTSEIPTVEVWHADNIIVVEHHVENKIVTHPTDVLPELTLLKKGNRKNGKIEAKIKKNKKNRINKEPKLKQSQDKMDKLLSMTKPIVKILKATSCFGIENSSLKRKKGNAAMTKSKNLQVFETLSFIEPRERSESLNEKSVTSDNIKKNSCNDLETTNQVEIRDTNYEIELNTNSMETCTLHEEVIEEKEIESEDIQITNISTDNLQSNENNASQNECFVEHIENEKEIEIQVMHLEELIITEETQSDDIPSPPFEDVINEDICNMSSPLFEEVIDGTEKSDFQDENSLLGIASTDQEIDGEDVMLVSEHVEVNDELFSVPEKHVIDDDDDLDFDEIHIPVDSEKRDDESFFNENVQSEPILSIVSNNVEDDQLNEQEKIRFNATLAAIKKKKKKKLKLSRMNNSNSPQPGPSGLCGTSKKHKYTPKRTTINSNHPNIYSQPLSDNPYYKSSTSAGNTLSYMQTGDGSLKRKRGRPRLNSTFIERQQIEPCHYKPIQQQESVISQPLPQQQVSNFCQLVEQESPLCPTLQPQVSTLLQDESYSYHPYLPPRPSPYQSILLKPGTNQLPRLQKRIQFQLPDEIEPQPEFRPTSPKQQACQIQLSPPPQEEQKQVQAPQQQVLQFQLSKHAEPQNASVSQEAQKQVQSPQQQVLQFQLSKESEPQIVSAPKDVEKHLQSDLEQVQQFQLSQPFHEQRLQPHLLQRYQQYQLHNQEQKPFKKRGRPLGSKNKKKSLSEYSEMTSFTMPMPPSIPVSIPLIHTGTFFNSNKQRRQSVAGTPPRIIYNNTPPPVVVHKLDVNDLSTYQIEQTFSEDGEETNSIDFESILKKIDEKHSDASRESDNEPLINLIRSRNQRPNEYVGESIKSMNTNPITNFKKIKRKLSESPPFSLEKQFGEQDRDRTKTYSNINVQKVFVPPDVENLIQEQFTVSGSSELYVDSLDNSNKVLQEEYISYDR